MKSLLTLNKYFFRYKGRLILGLVFVAVSNILIISQSEVIANATNEFMRYADGSFNREKNYFLYQALILLALAIGSGIFMFLKRQFIIVLSRLIEADMKDDIYAHYQVLDLAFYKRNNTGDLMNRISEDVGKVRMYIGPAVMYVVDTFFTVATGLFYMLSNNVLLTIVVFTPLPILSYAIFKVSHMINKRSTKVQENLSHLTSQAQESFSGIRIIKAYVKENYFGELFAKRSNEYRASALKLARTEAMFHPFIVLLIGLSLIAVIYFSGKLYINGEIKDIGILTSFVFIVYKLTWPFATLGWITSLIQRAAASQTRINEFLNSKPDVENKSNKMLQPIKKIQFENVSFTYPDTGIRALKGINFEINAGETVAITGPTGSGKSTIAAMLTRLYDVDKGGRLLINEENISSVNLKDLRTRTGYVPQDVFLFSDTVKNNISFGLFNGEQKNTEKIIQAAKDAEVHGNIIDFPEKYETIVGERGVTLSGGQKQRISIARAIIKDPELLIFDDCLSAVDTETEDNIVNNLKRIMKGKSSIIISHRVSSIKHADKIIYLKNGEIIEMGSHEELMLRNGEYAELNRLQGM